MTQIAVCAVSAHPRRDGGGVCPTAACEERAVRHWTGPPLTRAGHWPIALFLGVDKGVLGKGDVVDSQPVVRIPADDDVARDADQTLSPVLVLRKQARFGRRPAPRSAGALGESDRQCSTKTATPALSSADAASLTNRDLPAPGSPPRCGHPAAVMTTTSGDVLAFNFPYPH